MKLVIQIPCYNEEATIAETLQSLPLAFSDIRETEVLVIDDGSQDRSAQIVSRFPNVRVISLPSHQGLARTFASGIKAALERGADIIVNTDADNQYCAKDIENLIRPITTGNADFVLGTRVRSKLPSLPFTKRVLYAIGAWVMRRVTGLPITDPTSGFRAISRQAAMRLEIRETYTYTLETLIQASAKGWRVLEVPVRTNPVRRPSRLIRNIPQYLFHSLCAILRSGIYWNFSQRKARPLTTASAGQSPTPVPGLESTL